MNLRVINCPDINFKPFVEKAALFYSQELIKNTKIRNNCFTTIKFDNNITEYGYASVEGYNSRKQPRRFCIEIHPGIGARKILETLAHEMVHIKQYIYNETDGDLSRWYNKKINPEKVDYWNHPWEIDAHGRETGLLTKFAVQECLWEIFDEFKDPNSPIISMPIRWKKYYN